MAAVTATLGAIDPNDVSKNTFRLENASTLPFRHDSFKIAS
jgi:hypothetical protein